MALATTLSTNCLPAAVVTAAAVVVCVVVVLLLPNTFSYRLILFQVAAILTIVAQQSP